MHFKDLFLKETHKNQIFTIYNPEYIDSEVQKELKKLKLFRKGPFLINTIRIESQWNSFIKWKYLLRVLKKIQNNLEAFKKRPTRILDIGANNGYYSFLLYYYLKVNGFACYVHLLDPIDDFYQQYLFLKKFFPIEDQKRWYYHKIGWQEIPSLKDHFDIILCMGVLYHHKNAVELLEKIFMQLNTKGILILETITIKYGTYPIFLLPQKKYAGSKGIWFLPNRQGILCLLNRLNFRNIEFHSERFVLDEMKGISYLPSLQDMLKKNKTIEEYPKPYRSFFSCIK